MRNGDVAEQLRVLFEEVGMRREKAGNVVGFHCGGSRCVVSHFSGVGAPSWRAGVVERVAVARGVVNRYRRGGDLR